MDKWTPEDIGNYEDCIRAAEKHDDNVARRKDQWYEDFINGKDMSHKPFDTVFGGEE